MLVRVVGEKTLRGGVTFSQSFHWLGARGVPASRPLGERQPASVGSGGEAWQRDFIYLFNFRIGGVLVLLLQLPLLDSVHAHPVEQT